MVVNPQSSIEPKYLTSKSEAVLQFPVQRCGGANKTGVWVDGEKLVPSTRQEAVACIRILTWKEEKTHI